MNGSDIERVEQVFAAKIEPLVVAVKDLGVKSDKHYKKITVLETKFEAVGNCAEHAAKVDSVQREIGIVDDKTRANGNRIWGLVILLLMAALGLAAKAYYWGF